jgi:hypothetical protein
VGQYVPRFESHVGTSPVGNHLATPAVQEVTENADPSAKIAAQQKGRWGTYPWWVAGIIGLVILGCGLGYSWMRARRQKVSAPAATPNEIQGQRPERLIGPPVGQEIRILAGSSRSLVDHAGKLWSADYGFTGGSALRSSIPHIARTQDPWFYRSSRQGQFRYDIPLPKVTYELRLHFAETVFGPESGGAGGEGSRIMTIRANGKTLLSDFDIVADAGASLAADIKVFSDITPAADGALHLEFAGEEGKQATLSAIEILPGFQGRMRPVRILARQTPYYSNDSRWWSPDNYFEGGQLAAYTTTVTGIDDPELFESERWGNFSYAIPVTPGRYVLTLYFAARHNNPAELLNSENKGKEIEHVFNVFCNGKVLLQNFDLTKEAHETDGITRKFPDLEPNAQGKLLVSFEPVNGYATVVGIEVLPQ